MPNKAVVEAWGNLVQKHSTKFSKKHKEAGSKPLDKPLLPAVHISFPSPRFIR